MISSNDEANFTFKGRFLTKEEAFAIGYEDSQKVHNALKWILRKQGTSYDGMYFVTWESNSGQIPDWLSDSDEICRQAEERGIFETARKKEACRVKRKGRTLRRHAARWNQKKMPDGRKSRNGKRKSMTKRRRRKKLPKPERLERQDSERRSKGMRKI